MIGQRFGRLLVLSEFDIPKGVRRYVCQCDCGNRSIVRGNSLRTGHTSSCGCAQRERAATSNITHGDTTGGKWSAEYTCWKAMLQRVRAKEGLAYKDYVQRGITVCERWQKFENFLADMGRRPSPKHSIDRRDNDGNYEPGNCRWATRVQQMHNQGMRRNNTSGHKGVRWCERLHKWVAQINLNGVRKHLGCFREKEAAVAAYSAAAMTVETSPP